MNILSNTFAFITSFLIIIYLALKYRYFKNNKEVIRKRKYKNMFDLVLTLTILMFSILHVNSFINELQTGNQAKSYAIYILISIVIYFIWMIVNVKLYRKEINKFNT